MIQQILYELKTCNGEDIMFEGKGGGGSDGFE